MKQSPLLTGVVMVLIFVAGFFLGRWSDNGAPLTSFNANSTSPTAAEQSNSGTNQSSSAEGPATVDTSTLPAGQRQMLEALGIDTSSITITPEMVACAEAKLGVERVAEIEAGATPSITEGPALLSCYSR